MGLYLAWEGNLWRRQRQRKLVCIARVFRLVRASGVWAKLFRPKTRPKKKYRPIKNCETYSPHWKNKIKKMKETKKLYIYIYISIYLSIASTTIISTTIIIKQFLATIIFKLYFYSSISNPLLLHCGTNLSYSQIP